MLAIQQVAVVHGVLLEGFPEGHQRSHRDDGGVGGGWKVALRQRSAGDVVEEGPPLLEALERLVLGHPGTCEVLPDVV